MENHKLMQLLPKFLVAGGSVLLAAGLLMDFHLLPAFLRGKKDAGEPCQQVLQAQAKLSNEQLAKLLVVPEGDRKQRVREILRDPYCKLADLQIRVGAIAQREAYPLDVDPRTWLIVLYEGDQYAGYRLNSR